MKFNEVIHLYADDTVILVAADTVNELVVSLNDELMNFYKWLVSNKLTVNIAKSKVLPYYTRAQGNFLEGKRVTLNNMDLGIIKQYTY